MAKRVTIQDIAEELGISRNTVSKAINNSAGLAEATREKILQKAMEMGYKQFSYLDTLSALTAKPGGDGGSVPRTDAPVLPDTGPREIAVLTGKYLDYSHFASPLLDKIQQDVGELGYTLNTHRVHARHMETLALPSTFQPARAAAVICIEIFDRPYADLICKLNLPVLFVDGPARFSEGALSADQLLMENGAELARFTADLIGRGITRIGFVGDYTHCQSFFERYLAFRTVMGFLDVPVKPEYCVKSTDRAVIQKRLQAMDPLPEAFLCANDFLAIDVLDALRTMGKSVPEDVLLCGFDDAPEAGRTMPPLTTVHIHTQIMAYTAVQLLLSRMKCPDMAYRLVHTQTDLVLRASTEGAGGVPRTLGRKLSRRADALRTASANTGQSAEDTKKTARGRTDRNEMVFL